MSVIDQTDVQLWAFSNVTSGCAVTQTAAAGLLLAEAMAMQRGLIAAAFAAACAVTIGVLSTRAVVRSNAKRLQVRCVDLLLASSYMI